MKWVYIKRVLSVLMICTPLAFLWMACWVTVYPLGRRRSRQQLPSVFKAIGFTPEGQPAGLPAGTMEGLYQGYPVRVEPESAEVQLEFNRWKNVEINDQKAYHGCREDLREFTAASPLFNTIFRTRRVHPEDSTSLSQPGELIQALENFYMQWLWRLQMFRIDDNGLQCRLSSGQPFAAHIPAPALEPLLRDMCRLAKLIEARLTDKPE